MRGVVAIWMTALVGCGRFGFDDRSSSDAGSSDGRSGDDSAAACAQPVLDETFTSTTPCSDWGYPYTFSTAMTQGGGQLMIAPTTSDGGGGCTSMTMPSPSSITVEVPEALTPDSAYTQLALNDPDRSITAQIGVLALATLDHVTVFGQVPYDAPRMRWWRIRTLADAYEADYSADGTHWTTFASAPTVVAPSRYTIAAGTVGEVATNMAVFQRLTVCP